MDPYDELRRTRPEEFVNPSGGVEILSSPEEVRKARESAGGEIGVVYQDAYVTVVRDAVRFPDGSLGAYVRVLGSAREPGVVALPLLAGKVVLVEHFRHATRDWHLEAPRGFGEPGTDSAENVVRELAEELEAEVTELVDLGELHPDSGMLGRRVRLWAARVESIGAVSLKEGIRRAVVVDSVEAEEMVGDGRITDSFTVAVLARARWRGLLG